MVVVCLLLTTYPRSAGLGVAQGRVGTSRRVGLFRLLLGDLVVIVADLVLRYLGCSWGPDLLLTTTTVVYLVFTPVMVYVGCSCRILLILRLVAPFFIFSYRFMYPVGVDPLTSHGERCGIFPARGGLPCLILIVSL